MNATYYATVQNQYGLLIGDGFGPTPEEASRLANESADRKLKTANPNWKWLKAKRHVGEWKWARA